jgi:hypothetical protein
MPMNESGIIETTHTVDDKLIFNRRQDVSEIIRRNKFEASEAPSMRGDAAWRKVGSIPLVVAEDWARECGYPVNSPGWIDHAKKKLRDGEFAAFRVKGI